MLRVLRACVHDDAWQHTDGDLAARGYRGGSELHAATTVMWYVPMSGTRACEWNAFECHVCDMHVSGTRVSAPDAYAYWPTR